MEEVWKDAVGYEGYYQVSNLGRVKSIPRKYNKRVPFEKMRKQRLSLGYAVLNLSLRGVVKTVKVHRLVAEAFLSNCEGKPEVNHIDGNRSNNNLDNLEWSTRLDNTKHAIESGRHVGYTGDKQVAKLDDNGKVIGVFPTIKEANLSVGVLYDTSNISRACKGSQQKAFGYRWEYV